MSFLIRCDDDGSHCIVEEADVVCDKNVVKIGDSVTFFWKKKAYIGEIVNESGKNI